MNNFQQTGTNTGPDITMKRSSAEDPPPMPPAANSDESEDKASVKKPSRVQAPRNAKNKGKAKTPPGSTNTWKKPPRPRKKPSKQIVEVKEEAQSKAKYYSTVAKLTDDKSSQPLHSDTPLPNPDLPLLLHTPASTIESRKLRLNELASHPIDEKGIEVQMFPIDHNCDPIRHHFKVAKKTVKLLACSFSIHTHCFFF